MEISSFLHLNLLKGHGCKYTNLFRIGLKNRIKKQHFLRFAAATRVELVSENLSVQLSTSVVYLLKFLKLTADKQAVSISSS